MKFSITIPAYKGRFLDEAIRSVLSQTYHDWELIIVDDCSPEKLKVIVEPYLSDTRIRYFRNEKNCGADKVVDNWNICLSYCSGEYVICIGDDDCLTSCCLQEYKNLIEKYPNLNVYHGRAEIIDVNSCKIGEQEKRPEWESALSLTWNRWAAREMQFIGDFCYRVEHLRECGGYYWLPLAWGSDDITAVRAAKENGIANTLNFCFKYRVNDYSITSSGNAGKKMDATSASYLWFVDFIDSEKRKNLSDSDLALVDSIKPVMNLYYYRSVGQNCVDVMRGNPLKISLCMKKLKVFGYPCYTFFRFYLTSLKKSFGFHRL